MSANGHVTRARNAGSEMTDETRQSIVELQHAGSHAELMIRFARWADAQPNGHLTFRRIEKVWGVSRNSARRWLAAYRSAAIPNEGTAAD